MNEISQLSVVCTHITHDASGKAKETGSMSNRTDESNIEIKQP